MPGSTVVMRVEGLAPVVRGLLALGLEVDDLKDAFSTIAREGAELVAAAAPKLTGRLAGDVRGNRARSKAVVTAGRVSVPYAGPINYGWAAHNITGAGFMQVVDQPWSADATRRLEQDINHKISEKGLR